MIQVEKYNSIHDIDEQTWNSIVPSESFFHSYRFIQSIEDAQVEESKFWYLFFHTGSKLVGSAALSAFRISLDLFSGETIRKAVMALRKIIPHFFQIKVLFCGLPISIGKHNLVISDPRYADEIIAGVNREMVGISNEEKIRYLCIKEFDEDLVGGVKPFEDHGFFLIPSLPYVTMDIKWSSFGQFLSSLRCDYRRQIKCNLKKIGWDEPVIEAGKTPRSDRASVTAVLNHDFFSHRKRFFELYKNVMDRANVRLEELNLHFFENLITLMNGDIETISIVNDDDILGYAVISQRGKTMSFVLTGLDYQTLGSCGVYFNLLYSILKLAIDRECTKLDLGQTSYYSKQRIGGKCVKTYFYVKSTNAITHSFLRLCRKFLIPETFVGTYRVFK